MVNGWMTRITVMSGCPMPALISSPILPTGTGYTATKAGPGLPITPGAGLLSIMAAGSSRTGMDGCGFPDRNGPPPGLAGGTVPIIMAGRLWDPALESVSRLEVDTIPPPHYWSFVPHQYVASPQVRNYYVSQDRNVSIIHNTTVINNTVINNNGRNNNMGE